MPESRLTVGNVEILSLNDAELALPLADVFPAVPAADWAPYMERYPEGFLDGVNLNTHFECYLVRSEGETILVDTGLGGNVSNPHAVRDFAGGVEGRLMEDESAALVRTASRDIVMGLVNRAMEPGCAWPRLTILWGPQGCGKSSFLELLLPSSEAWYYESPKFPLNDEELFDNTRRKWLVEFSDPSTRRAEAESAKTFVSRKSYSYRHRYGTLSTEHAYGFHAVMTGNPSGNTVIPPDASGYRRYLSVDCVKKLKDYWELKGWLDTHRDHIWAEALHRYRAGERFQELPESMHTLRDAAAEAKVGNGHLDHFFEVVTAQLERGGDGLALHELVTGFLTTWDGFNGPRVPDGGRGL